MARPIAGVLGALVAVLILDGLHYLNYTSAKFNHDVIQLPFGRWPGSPSIARCAAAIGGNWLLLGLAVGLSFWAKYFVAVLAVPLGLFVLLDRNARQRLATPGPYIALAAAVATWRRIWFGWCRTISCRSPMPSIAPSPPAG
ncbi:MAG: glycosyltransferase family 39 protein [Pseudolabrys sp.]